MQTLYTVSKAFSERLFRVPDYQRGYAWEKQQWQDFLEDLTFLPDARQHYMGTLILHERADVEEVFDEEGNPYTTFDVVDGQQRLTTIVLYLDAIRREMFELGAEMAGLARGLSRTYIAVDRLSGGPPMPKLTLNRDTNGFFQDVVLSNKLITPPTIRSHEQLAGAKAHFTLYLADKRAALRDEYVEWLRTQYLKVTQHLTMMVYALQTEADAGVVFETMNNRGKELTDLEKTKNYLLYLASKLNLPPGHGLASRINETWTRIFERMMAADLSELRNEDQLLRAHWLMAYDYMPKNWDGSRSIKARFSLRKYAGRHDELLGELFAYLDSLRNATEAYCDVYNPEARTALSALTEDCTLQRQIKTAAARFARLGAPVTFLPFLMAVRISAVQEPEAYLEALELAEKYAFRVYRWVGRPAHTGRSRMFRYAYDLFHGRTVSSVLDGVRNTILHYCSDRQFRDRFEREGLDWYHWGGLKYCLYEYEQHLADKAGLDVRMPWEYLSRKKDTVEHVLPQTPDAGGYWAACFPLKEYERCVHDIGNLTLTYDNTCLGNKPFPEKKGDATLDCCYASSRLFIEHYLARYKEWTEKEIRERREQIRAWAIDRWRVEVPETHTPDGDPDTKTEKYSVENIVALADENDVGETLRELMEAATPHGIGLRPWKRCLVFAPPQNGNWTLFTVWPKPGRLHTGVWFGVWTKFFHVPQKRLHAVLGSDEHRDLTAENVDEFIDRLNRVFEEIVGSPGTAPSGT
jgi:uncharacterized protein DUF262/uncharacterized protein DUF1524